MAKKVRKVTNTGNIIKFLNSLVGTMTHNTEAVKKTASKTSSKSRSVTTAKKETTSKRITNNTVKAAPISKKITNAKDTHNKNEIKKFAKAFRKFTNISTTPTRNRTKSDKKQLAKAFYDIMNTKTPAVRKKVTSEEKKNTTYDNAQTKDRNTKSTNKNTYEEQKAFTEDNSETFMGLLFKKIMDASQNPQRVLNDVVTLKVFLRELVAEYPSYRDIANKFLEETEIRLEYGAFKDEGKIRKLAEEFKENPYRTFNRDGISYDTSLLDINAGIYLEAVYRTFKDEALEKGITNVAFRRELDFLLANKPFELYEEYTTSNGKTARSRILKSPREIADMAMSRAKSIKNVNIV